MMPLKELREVARQNGSVNVDLADRYALRWHDPEWLATWERWQKARAAWDKTWPFVDMIAFRLPFDVFSPDVVNIGDPVKRAVAQEYLDARVVYKAATQEMLDG